MAAPFTIVSAAGKGAAISNDGEIWITETERENNVRAAFALNGIAASSWAILVDLSDNVNWPHEATGAVHVSVISSQVDKAANSVGLMQLGVVTRVDGTSGDVKTFAALRFQNGGSDNIIRDINVSPSQIKCDVVAGVTTKLISNATILNDTGLQTDLAIPTAFGSNAAPGVGDLVIRYTHTSGSAWTGAFAVLYHTHSVAS